MSAFYLTCIHKHLTDVNLIPPWIGQILHAKTFSIQFPKVGGSTQIYTMALPQQFQLGSCQMAQDVGAMLNLTEKN